MAVTHPGGANRDDFLTAALLLVAFPGIEIVRRQPTAFELNDPTCWVFDIGGRHEPALGNFDHHQLPPEAPATCAFTLVLEHLGLLASARRAWSWLKFTEILDSKGPTAAAEAVGTTWDKLRQTISPTEIFDLNDFGRCSVVVDAAILENKGRGMLDQLMAFDERQALLEAAGKVIAINGLDVVVVPDTEATRRAPAFGVEEWRRLVAPHAAASVTPDNRGPGMTLFRFDEHPAVDFRRISDEPDVAYVGHKGFIAKITTCEWSRIETLLKQSIDVGTAMEGGL